MRRVIAALGALVAIAAGASIAVPGRAGAADVSCPANTNCLVVHWHGSVAEGQKAFTVADLHDVQSQQETNYPFCSQQGCPNGPQYSDALAGATLRDLILNHLDVSFAPESVQTLTITADASGRTSSLTGNDLRDGSDSAFPFADNDLGLQIYPYVYGTGSGTGAQFTYLRPQHVNDPGDPAYADEVDTVSGNMTVDIEVAGTTLAPTISASPSSIDVGDSTTLTAHVSNTHGDVTYDWDFGNGHDETTSTSTVTYRYPGPGSFGASVQVSDTGGGAGHTTEPATILVGPQPTPTPTTGSGSSGHGTATSGPSVGPQSGSGIHVGGGSTSATEGPTRSAPPLTSGVASSVTSNAAAAQSSAASSSSAPARRDDGLVAINGILLNPDGTTITEQPAQRAGDVGAAPAARAGSVDIGLTSSVFGAVLIAAVLALLALGAVSEWRRPGHGPRRGRRS